MPPIVGSLLIVFVYQQFLNIHFYYGENRIVFTASIVAAGLNLVLNAIFIRMFGYIAAGYTTLVSYIVIAVLYYISMKRISENRKIEYKDYFDISFIFHVITIFGCSALIVVLLYPYPWIRYIIVMIIAISVIVMQKYILNFVKRAGLFKKVN